MEQVVEFVPFAVEEELTKLSREESRLSLRRDRVVAAFQQAFEDIGGVTRLAAWADTHETEFYKLYARLLPQAPRELPQTDGVRRIIHAIPRTQLDG
jgi:hypothetical protein